MEKVLVSGLNEAEADVRREFAIARAEVAQCSMSLASAAHWAAREERQVWFEGDRDGMCWVTAHLSAEVGRKAMARLDAASASLAAEKDETRTLAQLRADIAGDLLIGGGAGGVPAVRVSVAVTVPVLTLLGVEELPGTLEGLGPIDADTARRLAAHAPSFHVTAWEHGCTTWTSPPGATHTAGPPEF